MGQFVMARLGDIGPYRLGNIKIVQCQINCSEKEMPKGSLSGTSKLTEADIREIRSLEGTVKRPLIAKRFGINIWHVRDIQKRRSWAWLE